MMELLVMMMSEDIWTALSGICGSISLASWIVVLMPQLIENYRTKSYLIPPYLTCSFKCRGDALALNFIIIWFIGDVFSFLG